LWTIVDVKACFHNFPVVAGAETFLGIITQDGLFVYLRMPFGLTSAPMWCQFAMDEVVQRAGVKGAKAFFDDITIPGNKGDWQTLWENTLRVIRALTQAGFMIGLKKCKFLAPSVTVLGY
jgi:hypothetical protein